MSLIYVDPTPSIAYTSDMCGIFGIWHHDGKPLDLLALKRATTVLAHRGPDDEGYLLVNTRSGRAELCGGESTVPQLGLPRLEEFLGAHFDMAFGFRRLSILDLSPAGHQPMRSPDGRYWLVYNGEVYNYLELRAELASKGHHFRTDCDTEVLLAAYAEWGPACLSRLNGMWAFAIWDNIERRLFIARDRFGVKPFYIAHIPGQAFTFASEIKALLAANAVPFHPSPSAVAAYVAQGRSPSHLKGDTFFEGVTSLPAAHYALVSEGGCAPQRYWALPGQELEPPLHQAQQRYADLFTDSVRLRLRADVAVGTCLSGGVDSSSIVATTARLMRTEHAVSLERLGERQQTFSAVYDTDGPWNERRYIDLVLSHTGAGGNYVWPSGERLWDDLERLVWHQDEPFQSTSIFAQWCVMRQAKELGATVLLDGQGADEVLGGYRPFSIWLGELLRAGRVRQALQSSSDIHAVTGLSVTRLLARATALQLPGGLLTQARHKRLRHAASTSGLREELGHEWLATQQKDNNFYANQRNLTSHLAHLIEESLPDLLRYEDRNSMAFSVEARLPFLDYRLVEYVFSQAYQYRIHNGWTKWLQREAVKSLLPGEVVWRRDKVGFETPETQWLRASSSHILDILSDHAATGRYLDEAYIRNEVPRLLEQGDTSKVWRWVNLALWLHSTSQANG